MTISSLFSSNDNLFNSDDIVHDVNLETTMNDVDLEEAMKAYDIFPQRCLDITDIPSVSYDDDISTNDLSPPTTLNIPLKFTVSPSFPPIERAHVPSHLTMDVPMTSTPTKQSSKSNRRKNTSSISSIKGKHGGLEIVPFVVERNKESKTSSAMRKKKKNNKTKLTLFEEKDKSPHDAFGDHYLEIDEVEKLRWPACYFNFNLFIPPRLNSGVAAITPRFNGLQTCTVYRLYPRLKQIFLDKVQNNLNALSKKELKLMENRQVPSLHILQSPQNTLTTVKQYLRFVEKYEEKHLIPCDYDVFFEPIRVRAFVGFWKHRTPKSRTVRNKCQQLLWVLRSFQNYTQFCTAHYTAKYNACRNILLTLSGQMKNLASMENALHESEAELVSAGKWFAVGEDTIFLQWVIMKATNIIVERGDRKWTLDEIQPVQGYFIALVVMVFPGQRREVYANLRVNNLFWYTDLKTQEEYIAAGLLKEKVIRKKQKKIALPSFLKLWILYWIEHVQNPCRLSEDIFSLWLNSTGGPLEFKAFSHQFQVTVHTFNNDLIMGPKAMRQSTITTFYANSAEFVKEHIDKVMTMLNCSASTMSNYYDRRTLDDELRKTQESVLLSPKLFTPQVKDRLAKADDVLKGLVNERIIGRGVGTSTRTPRLTVDDDEWAKQYEEISAIRVKKQYASYYSIVETSPTIATTSSVSSPITTPEKQITLTTTLDDDDELNSTVVNASTSIAPTTSTIKQINLVDDDDDDDLQVFQPSKTNITIHNHQKKKSLKDLSVGDRYAWYGLDENNSEWLGRHYLSDISTSSSSHTDNKKSTLLKSSLHRKDRQSLFSVTLYSSDDEKQ